MNIFYKDNCPICSNELIEVNYLSAISYKCENDCYEYNEFHNYTSSVYVFNKNFHNIHEETDTEDILKEIEYWKENERYLMKILER